MSRLTTQKNQGIKSNPQKFSLSLSLSFYIIMFLYCSSLLWETLEIFPPTQGFNLRYESMRLAGWSTLKDKFQVIDADSRVKRFLSFHHGFARVLSSLRLNSGRCLGVRFFLLCSCLWNRALKDVVPRCAKVEVVRGALREHQVLLRVWFGCSCLRCRL